VKCCLGFAWGIAAIWAFACANGPLAAADGLERAERQAVDAEERAKVVAKIESALKHIKRRAAADETLKPLASAAVEQETFPETNDGLQGKRIRLHALAEDQIEFDTTAGPAKRPGGLQVLVEYVTKPPQLAVFSGLYNGSVPWKTNDPHVFVFLSWCTHDSDAADHLLTIVREELAREELHLAPTEKLDWPPATPSERLSQLLPPTHAQPAAKETDEKTAGEKAVDENANVFASPQQVVSAYRQAYAKKDWRRCAMCLSPAAQGAAIREFLFVTGVSPTMNRKLKPTFDKHLGPKPAEETAEDREKTDVIRKIFAALPTGSEEVDNRLIYDGFHKQIADIPAFLADCWEAYPNLRDLGEIRGIVVDGDKASGFYTWQNPPPTPEHVLPHCNPFDLPRFSPWHFCKIDGGWLFADPPLSG
jgi:hypothetical protein